MVCVPGPAKNGSKLVPFTPGPLKVPPAVEPAANDKATAGSDEQKVVAGIVKSGFGKITKSRA